jgi:hypothetical protein
MFHALRYRETNWPRPFDSVSAMYQHHHDDEEVPVYKQDAMLPTTHREHAQHGHGGFSPKLVPCVGAHAQFEARRR